MNFNILPEIIQLAVMMYVRFPLSLRNVEDLLRKRGIDIAMTQFGIGWTASAATLPIRSESTVLRE